MKRGSTTMITKNVVENAIPEIGQTSLFQDLPEEAKQVLRSMQREVDYPKGSALFSEGQAASGIFFLVRGRVRLSVAPRQGKKIVLRTVKPGEIFGLSSSISGGPHRATADAEISSRVFFIRREDFMPFIHAHPEVSFRMVECMSRKLGACFEQVRLLC